MQCELQVDYATTTQLKLACIIVGNAHNVASVRDQWYRKQLGFRCCVLPPHQDNLLLRQWRSEHKLMSHTEETIAVLLLFVTPLSAAQPAPCDSITT